MLLGGRNLKDGRLLKTDKDSYAEAIPRPSFQRAIAQPGDVVVSTLFDRRKLYLYREGDPPAVVNNSCAIIRAGKQSDYILSYLRNGKGQQDFLNKASEATGGAFIPRLSAADLAGIRIPILPFDELARLGHARIEHSSDNDLLALKEELESSREIIERLQSEKKGIQLFYEDRLRAISERIETNTLSNRIQNG